PTKPARASSTGTSGRAGPSQAAASHGGPGIARPRRAVTGRTDTNTAVVRSRISRVRPYGAVATSASSGSWRGPYAAATPSTGASGATRRNGASADPSERYAAKVANDSDRNAPTSQAPRSEAAAESRTA